MCKFLVLSADISKVYNESNIILLDLKTMGIVQMGILDVEDMAKSGEIGNMVYQDGVLQVIKPSLYDVKTSITVKIDSLSKNSVRATVPIARITNGIYLYVVKMVISDSNKHSDAISINKIDDRLYAIKFKVESSKNEGYGDALEYYFSVVDFGRIEAVDNFINEAMSLEWVERLNKKRKIIGLESFNILKIGDDAVMFSKNGAECNIDNSLDIPEGVTVLAGNGTLRCSEIKFPKSLKEIRCRVEADLAYGFRQDIVVSGGYAVKCRLAEVESNNEILVMPKDTKVNEGVYCGVVVNRVLYYEPESAALNDKSLSWNGNIQELGIVTNNDINICDEQFSELNNLKRIITPKCKIARIGTEGLYNCMSLREIDLSECREIGESGMEVEKNASSERIIIRFNKDIKLFKNALKNKVRAVIFGCDNVWIENNVFGKDVNILCYSRKVYNYLITRKCLENKNIRIKMISNIELMEV